MTQPFPITRALLRSVGLLLAVLARAPWWATLLLALAGYLLYRAS